MSTRNRAMIAVAAVTVTVSAAVTAAAAVVAVVDLSAEVAAINERAEAEVEARDDHNRQVEAVAVDISAGVTAINERAEAEAEARDDHNRLVGAVRERLLDSMSDDCFGYHVNSAPQQTVCLLEYVAALQAIQFAS